MGDCTILSDGSPFLLHGGISDKYIPRHIILITCILNINLCKKTSKLESYQNVYN